MRLRVWQAVCWIIIFVCALAVRAEAVTITFQTRVDNQDRKATVDITERDRVSYVSLNDVALQLGGKCSQTKDKVEVDYAGGVAWVGRNDSQVNASFGKFTLKHLVAVDGKAVFIALSDVVPFFNNAFHATVTQGAPDETASQTPAPTASPKPPDETPPATAAPAPAPQPAVDDTPKQRQTTLRTVVLDAGHGGSDSGAVGPAGVKEKDVALSIVNRLAKSLQSTYGVKSLLTRSDDVNISPEKRVSAANYNKGDLLISIHTGTSALAKATGFQIFYASPTAIAAHGSLRDNASSTIAQSVAAALTQALSTPSRGVREAPCRLFQGLAMPGIVIELGPISTSSSEALLADDAQQQRIADAIASGLMKATQGTEKAPT